MGNNRIENTDFKKLIGKWKTEGRILKAGKSPEMKITGTDTYEAILGGFFILHTADVLMGNEKSQTYEIIGLDKSNDQAILQHYNNQGSSGKMKGTLKNDKFEINGEGLRFNGRFKNNDNEIAGTWEKLTDQSNWVEFLKINLTKTE
ncbi:DUF1579 family protein [Algoriphagus resistens]|uniref:DUF1579 family protein n=1 Tax=Algoriphagus resistens TaxID=1750590 RepID=UPI0007169063|nr:DUF1579 family protein [Algoriphagus resistens]